MPLRPVVLFLLAAAWSARAANVSVVIKDTKGGAVADAVVSFNPLDGATAPTVATPAPVEISQRGQEFLPYVTAIRVGTPVSFPNREDKVEHQVYSLSAVKKFDLPLHRPGTSGSVVFDQPGVAAIGCNIHEWMLAYVVVLDTPWFARSDATGTARIDAVPPGRYRIEVWQPRLAKTETREITVGTGQVDPIFFSLALRPDKRIRRGVAAPGSGYK